MKTDLDLQFNAHGPRPADEIRSVDPAQPVEHLVAWEPGELDAWIRDGGQWLGQSATVMATSPGSRSPTYARRPGDTVMSRSVT
ncbi:hypothetical protein GCM10009554_36580 [Kribbella koreensis]|uniref:Uncharacterized protein n=2 Tax=Kribbella TaxID=182639 RepID=A0ABP6Z5Y6_9ACTN